LDKVVQIHIRAFKGYFLTLLGGKFLQIYYSHFIHKKRRYAVVATIDGEPVGFIAGTSETGDFYKELYKKNFFVLFKLLVFAFIREPGVRTKILSKYKHIWRALKSKLGLGRSSPASSGTVNCRLLSIAVDPAFQGKHVAPVMQKYFLECLKNDGIEKVGLSVLKENERAIQFYKKTGWKVEREEPNSISFFRDL